MYLLTAIKCIYCRLSLSRRRLSRITVYLSENLVFFLNGNLTTGNEISWKRREIAQYNSNFRSQITYSFVKCGCSIYFYLFFFSILQIRYVNVRLSRSMSESPLDFEITRIDCITTPEYFALDTLSGESFIYQNGFSPFCKGVYLNPFMPSGIFYHNTLDWSISNRRGVRLVFIITMVYKNSCI